MEWGLSEPATVPATGSQVLAVGRSPNGMHALQLPTGKGILVCYKTDQETKTKGDFTTWKG